jgi:hypothetical protein
MKMRPVPNVAKAMIEKAQVKKAAVHKNASVRLTSRDLDILEFINDMKFASVKEIHERFFVRRFDQENRPIFAARNRLYLLSAAGLLTTEKIADPDLTAFVVTQQGVAQLLNFKPMRTHPKPLGKVDLAVFQHDYAVLKARLFLEKHGTVSAWMSERLMEAELKITGGLATDYHPDAIYVLPNGERVAFEYERTQKNKDRYQKKVDKFYDLIKSSDAPAFHKVQYVCAATAIQKALSTMTEMYRELFQVELVEDFASRITRESEEARDLMFKEAQTQKIAN